MKKSSEKFPWPNYKGNFDFFEKRLEHHSEIEQWEKNSDGTYRIEWRDKKLRIFVYDCYAYGFAEYTETTEKLGEIDIIIAYSFWNFYSGDLKNHCQKNKIGLFTVKEFMGAMNRRDYWNYVPKDEK